MISNLDGWREIQDLPSAKDLTDLYRRHRDRVSRRAGLIAVAAGMEEYVHPGNPIVNGRILLGLRFRYAEGSVLLTFPFLPDVDEMPVGVYIIGNATVVHASGTVGRFQKALEQQVLPAEAHAADDP